MFSLPVSRMKFSEHCGRNIRLGRDSRSAVRVVGFNEGILLSEKKLPNDKVFEVCTVLRKATHSCVPACVCNVLLIDLCSCWYAYTAYVTK